MKHRRSGALESCTLAGPYVAGEHRLPPGSAVWFREDGSLRMSRLGADAPVSGQVLPTGTVLHFRPGNLLRHFWLPADTELQGHLVRSQSDGAGNRLHPNGRLLAIWLARDEDIDGVPCTSSGNPFRMGLGVIRLGTQRMVWFHDSGRLQQAMLSRDVELQGHRFEKGEVISLTPEGRIALGAPKLSGW
jgi:hypothetical protein